MAKADSIIYGRIVTLDTDKPLAEAMVVKDKCIVYVGTREIAETMHGEETEILDFGDNTVYPGFMDAHTHGPMAGERLALQAQLEELSCMQDYVDVMADYVKKYPNKKVYLGSGWDKYAEPTASMLDAICPDKPMILRTSDGHSLWLNTAAMKECGVDRDFVKKYGEAQVHVDENGDPSGLICEMALSAVLSHYPVTLEDMKEALLAWQDFAFSQGITAVGEALLDMYPVCAEAYAQLVAEGKWKLRTYAYAFNKDEILNRDAVMGNPDIVGNKLTELAARYNSEYFQIIGQKIILDGVIEAHTGSMIEPYSDAPDYYGVLNIQDPEHLRAIVASANKAGFPVHTHAIGDRAAMMTMDAYESVETETCNFDTRNVICHLQCIRPEDVQRCGDYNVVAVVAPTWAPVTHPTFDETVTYLGEQRAWEQYPLRAFEDAGATICFHTDYPVNPLMDVPLSVYTAVKRALPVSDRHGRGGPKSVMNPDEAISPLRALLAMTFNTAYMCRQESQLGTLHIGKIANATVYTQDFIHCPDAEDIVSAKLVATIVDGKVVYRA